MSRIGQQTIKIPDELENIEVRNNTISVEGPKGELSRKLHPKISVVIDKEKETVQVEVDDKNNNKQRALWGTFASHIQNMIKGTIEGFKKELEINGVGYRCSLKGDDLKLEVGFANPVIYDIPDGINASVEGNKIIIEGVDKELVGKVAAEIREVRPPEPYKGKGIKYVDEEIRRKEGKTATGEMGPGGGEV